MVYLHIQSWYSIHSQIDRVYYIFLLISYSFNVFFFFRDNNVSIADKYACILEIIKKGDEE